MKTKKNIPYGRNSNFEILRIIAMFAIVLGHIAAQAFDRDALSIGNNLFLYIVGSGSRISVNLFVMVGIWFMVDSKFKASRMVKLYGGLWFYSIFITIVLLITGINIEFGNVISSFFPFLRRRMWFIPQYLTLMLISPFLNAFFNRLGKKNGRLLIIVATVVIPFICSIRSFEDDWLDGFVWFAYLYFIVAYYKHYGFDFKFKSKECYIIFGVLIYLILSSGVALSNTIGKNNDIVRMFGTILGQYLGDYKSIPNFVCSLLIFMYFAQLDIGQKKWINEVSKNTSDVYMIHQQDAFIPVIWIGLFHTKEWQHSQYFILLYIGTALAVFVGCSIIGRIRVQFIEPLWMKSKLFKDLSDKIDKFYEPIVREIENSKYE